MSATITWKPITAERYFDMLGALPPALHVFEGFLLGEQYSSRVCRVTKEGRGTFMAFTQRGPHHFFEASEPLTKPEFREFFGERAASLILADKVQS
jgi:hypothetical protein